MELWSDIKCKPVLAGIVSLHILFQFVFFRLNGFRSVSGLVKDGV